MSQFVSNILPALFGAFTATDANDKIREKVLMNVYLCLRTFAWADGVNDELVHTCFDDTFNTWMALFIQIIQSNPKSLFDLKRVSLKCLTVIFRDFVNYSKDSINLIL
ncbi:MAG: hypothetical protein COA94_03705 [Rickettsiales bacterium]|nr:MAG: hypothetical protein COA94_03705 [Rickettsiales bacterium]